MSDVAFLNFGKSVADASKAWEFVESQDFRFFKEWRNLAMRYMEGYLEPPDGCTLSDTVYALMLRSANAGDVTACWYLGLWYLDNGESGGPILPVPPDETPLTMAIIWLEEGRKHCDHGTILRTREALQRLAWIYEFGRGDIPRSPEKALDVYLQMASERYWPECADYQKALHRLSGGRLGY